MFTKEDIHKACAVLSNAGLVLFPADTHWGVGCDATNTTAVDRLVRLNTNPLRNDIVVLMEDENKLPDYVSQPGIRIFDYIKGVSKPMTVIYKGARGVAAPLIDTDGSVAIRIVTDPFCTALLKQFNKPIAVIPAQLRRRRKEQDADLLPGKIKSGVDYMVQHRREDAGFNRPVSVIRWNNDGSLSILQP